jgi:uncharacterized protein (DUF362 family)
VAFLKRVLDTKENASQAFEEMIAEIEKGQKPEVFQFNISDGVRRV